MRSPLVPCPRCSRHVRVAEPSCPFCSAAFTREALPSPRVGTTQRLGRGKTFAFASAIAVVGCAGAVEPSGDGGADTVVRDTVTPADTSPPTDTVVPVDVGPPIDDGGAMTLYGLPPPPEDSGNPGFRYGAPPPSDGG